MGFLVDYHQNSNGLLEKLYISVFVTSLLLHVGFDLGVRQCGLRVNHVTLPPWSKMDPRLFILIHRQVSSPYRAHMNGMCGPRAVVTEQVKILQKLCL